MKIKKGTKLVVRHSRSGNWTGVALKDFDTKKDEWYPIALVDEIVEGQWIAGAAMPVRRGLCKVDVLE